MKPNEIKTNADLHKALKGFYEKHVTSLNGIIDKLPEALRTELSGLRDSLNKDLSALPPLEQVPAATETHWAFEACVGAVSRMAEYSNQLLERLGALKTDLAGKVTALNGFEQQVKEGALLTKDKVKELCDLARKEGAEAMRPDIVATRKSALELNSGLPVPGDDVLGLPAADYQARLEAAKANVAKLGEKGLKLGGKGDAWVKRTAWLPATEFAGQMTTIEDFIPSLRDPKGERKGDPLLGAPPAGEDKGQKGPAITLA